MSKKDMRNITRESLIARSQKNADERKYAQYECEYLNAVLTVKKLGLARVSDLLDMASGDESARGALGLYKQLIYESVPILHDAEVQAAFECAEPFDIVEEIFDNRLSEISKLAGFILGLHGIDNLEDDIKN